MTTHRLRCATCTQPHESGLHHVACFVPALQPALEDYRGRGIGVALDARTHDGRRLRDGRPDRARSVTCSNYMNRVPDLLRFYAYVRKAAAGWDGSRPLRRLR